jgi:hypothetical protein
VEGAFWKSGLERQFGFVMIFQLAIYFGSLTHSYLIVLYYLLDGFI